MFKGSPRRVLSESSLIPLLWMLALFTLGRDSRPLFLLNTVSFATMLGVWILALRLHPQAGWREILFIGLQTIVMTANVIFISQLFAVSDSARNLYLQVALFSTSLLGSGARLLTRFWYGWNRLRRRHFVWSLTHAHLMIVEGLIVSVLGAILLLQVLVFNPPAANDNTPLTWVEYVMSIEPYLTIAGIFTFFVLGILLPPSALFAYFVARRVVRRILVLETATALVEQGDYTVQVKVEGEDEIARLQARYNGMTRKLHSTIQKLQIEQATVAGLSKLQREMIANVSHDLRTPLTTLQAYLDSATSNSHETQLIKDEINHLRRLTDDLFEAAQQESLTLTLRLSPTAIQPLLAKIVEVTQVTARERRQIELLIDVPDSLPLLLIDADRFSQIIRNLLQNALRWTLPGGMILVQAAQVEGDVRVDIRDTGIGIAADELSNIWRRAYRVDHSVEGSGLGLYQVKQLVEAMHGRVDVESVVNRGSCFSVYLPIFSGLPDPH